MRLEQGEGRGGWPRSWPGETQRFSEVKEGAWSQGPGNRDSAPLLRPGHVWACALHTSWQGARGGEHSDSAAFVFSAILPEASVNTPQVCLQ